MKMFFEFLREYAKNKTDFEKKEIISRCKSILYLWKKNLKKALRKHKLLES